jgi:hypothetical protein
MFITNFATLPEQLKRKPVHFSERVGRYLNEKLHIPVLAVDADDEYYFADTEELREAVGKLPWWLKVIK